MYLDLENQEENRIVAGWLLYYYQRKKELDEAKDNILNSSPPTIKEVVISKTLQTGDPTGDKAAQLLEFIQETEKWLALVAEVEQRLPWRMQIVLILRQEAVYSSHRWVPYTQRRYAEEVAKKTGKDESETYINRTETFYEWWQRIIEYTARLACKRGLLK